MNFEIVNFTNIEDAINSLNDSEIEFLDLESIKWAKHYLNEGNPFLFAFSDIHNVFTYLDKEPLIVNVIVAVVDDYITTKEGNLFELSNLFKTDFPEIYKEMIEYSEIGLENYITSDKNPYFPLIQETIFNMINPKKIVVISPKTKKVEEDFKNEKK